MQWKDIPGYDGKYQINREGNVRRVYQSGKTRTMTPYHRKMKGSQRLVVKLTMNGKAKEEILLKLMAMTFLGAPPQGYVPYHKNGCQLDNCIHNIAYISRKELGKLTGAHSKRKSVAKINADGEIIDVYPSAREAARKNYMSHQTVMDRCNGKCISTFAPDGFAYAWEDEAVSMRHVLNKVAYEKKMNLQRKTG